MYRPLLLVCLLTAALLLREYSLAQSFRYMDESGNLHWVDSIEQIPPRYRSQVLLPTPYVTLSAEEKRRRQATPTKRPTQTPQKTATPKTTNKSGKPGLPVNQPREIVEVPPAAVPSAVR